MNALLHDFVVDVRVGAVYRPTTWYISRTYLRHLNVSVLCERASSRPASKGALGLAWSEHEVLPNCVSEFSA